MGKSVNFARVAPEVLLGMDGLTSSERMTFIAIRSHAGLEPGTVLEVQRLVEMTGDSRRTVQRNLARLEASGWLTVTREARIPCYYPRQLDTIAAPTPDWLPPSVKMTQGRVKMDRASAKAEPALQAHIRREGLEGYEKETGVANAPFGDEDRKLAEQRFVGLRDLMVLMIKGYAKPTVSPIPSSENGVNTENGHPLRPGDPIPGTPYFYQPAKPIEESEEEKERRRNYRAPAAKKLAPPTSGTW